MSNSTNKKSPSESEPNVPIENKIDGLKFVSQTHRAQFDGRRNYEYKIVFAVLSFYISTLAIIYGGQIVFPSYLNYKLIFPLIFLCLAVGTAIFLGYLHFANNINKTFAENAENTINDLFMNKNPSEPSLFKLDNTTYWISWRPIKGKKGKWAWFWQVLALFVFSITASILIILK
jgi:hypothetical protein